MIEDDRLLGRVILDFSMLEVFALQGNLALALRHAGNRGSSRPLMLALLERITRILLREGVLTRELLESMQRDEEDHGSADVARMLWTLR